MIEKILEIVEENSESWFGRFIPKSRLNYFCTSGNSAPHGKLTLFLFAERKDDPIAIVKVVRNHRYSSCLRTEYDNLVKLSHIRDKIKGVPQPYYYGELNKTSFLIESFLLGISLYNEFNNLFLSERHKERAEETLNKVFSWIRDFHLLTAKTMPAKEVLTEISSVVNIDDSSTIAVGTIQGDYWTRNILFDGSEIKVVDWEWCMQDVPIAWDVFFFMFTLLRQLTFYYPFKGQPAELVSLLKNNHWVVQLLKQKINNYLVEIGFSGKTNRYLLGCFLIYLAGRDLKRYGFESMEDTYWADVLNIMENELKDYDFIG